MGSSTPGRTGARSVPAASSRSWSGVSGREGPTSRRRGSARRRRGSCSARRTHTGRRMPSHAWSRSPPTVAGASVSAINCASAARSTISSSMSRFASASRMARGSMSWHTPSYLGRGLAERAGHQASFLVDGFPERVALCSRGARGAAAPRAAPRARRSPDRSDAPEMRAPHRARRPGPTIDDRPCRSPSLRVSSAATPHQPLPGSRSSSPEGIP